MKVGCDIDGVILDTQKIIMESIESKGVKAKFTQYHPTLEGVKDPASFMNDIVTDIFSNRMHEIEPYEDALFNIPNINKYIGPITFVTSRREEFNDNTNSWIQKHFPYLTYALVNRKSEDKVKFLLKENFKVFIEDRLRTANQVSEAGITTFLFNRPWNMNRETHKKVVRVDDIGTVVFTLMLKKYLLWGI